MQQLNLPNKLLKVEDLTFILPDDFEGSIEDALQLMIYYLKSIFNKKDLDNIEDLPSIFEDQQNRRLVMRFGIFERGKDGKYYLK